MRSIILTFIAKEVQSNIEKLHAPKMTLSENDKVKMWIFMQIIEKLKEVEINSQNVLDYLDWVRKLTGKIKDSF